MPPETNRDDERATRSAYADPVTRWLLMVAGLIVVMVVVGGFVRLSRAGLSIVRWDVVTGIFPPIGDIAWNQSFSGYQQTPEYQLVNTGMNLGDYQRIFYIEWAHRLIARIAGLLVILPLLWFLWRRLLTFRQSLRYWAIAALFGIQGAIGWALVSSGLRDLPTVSHFRLTIHLLTAVTLLGMVLWMALDRIAVARQHGAPTCHAASSTTRSLSWLLLGTVVIQIGYGGLVAGLKAGYLSNTWPLMFGDLIPGGMLATTDTWWSSLFEALAAHWIHRWFAFAVAMVAIALFISVRRDAASGRTRLQPPTRWLLGVVALQIAMGVSVVLFGVPTWLALGHQGLGMVLFSIALAITHDTQSVSQPTSEEHQIA